MTIDITTPYTPGWWVDRLMKKLAEQRARFDVLDAYYRGENGVPQLSSKACRDAYRRLMNLSRTNFAELVVEALRERVNPVGFRTGAEGDDISDKEAWRIWQANGLDADSALVHRACFTMSESFVIVGQIDPDIGAPLITTEDPRQVVVECDPVRRRNVIAALKVFTDDVAGVDRAYLYLPGQVFKASRNQSPGPALNADAASWEWDIDTPETLPAEVVPVVRFANRADSFGRAQGEFEPHLSVLDRINFTILNRLEIATMQAFKQRAIKGVPPTDADGNDIDYTEQFAADPGAMWLLPDTAEMWESQQVDLTPLRNAIRDDVQDLAAVTRTPLFYLTPDAANGSAEGASLAREGLVFKAEDRLKQLGESWEQVMSLAFLFANDTVRAQRADMEIIWASPERFSLAERYDAASKAGVAGVPWRTVMRDILQFSPQAVDRMEAERATDAFIAAVAATAAPEPQPQPVQ